MEETRSTDHEHVLLLPLSPCSRVPVRAHTNRDIATAPTTSPPPITLVNPLWVGNPRYSLYWAPSRPAAVQPSSRRAFAWRPLYPRPSAHTTGAIIAEPRMARPSPPSCRDTSTSRGIIQSKPTSRTGPTNQRGQSPPRTYAIAPRALAVVFAGPSLPFGCRAQHTRSSAPMGRPACAAIVLYPVRRPRKRH